MSYLYIVRDLFKKFLTYIDLIQTFFIIKIYPRLHYYETYNFIILETISNSERNDASNRKSRKSYLQYKPNCNTTFNFQHTATYLFESLAFFRISYMLFCNVLFNAWSTYNHGIIIFWVRYKFSAQCPSGTTHLHCNNF